MTSTHSSFIPFLWPYLFIPNRMRFSCVWVLGHFLSFGPRFSFQLSRKHRSLKVVLPARSGEREFGALGNISSDLFPCHLFFVLLVPPYPSCGYPYCPIHRVL
ncbi:hypothetical protein BDW74DRAFT_8704 [Aspergillus multicolor]|uniref:uncharacterized protein n=1 Tax=Aspergillus multicolor TaxID=41759 RepID=UPI003CCCFFC6